MMSRFVVVLGLLVPLAGCGGPAGPKTYPVSGTVTVDGEPVEEGYIIFQPTGPDDRAEGSEIRDGKFELRAMPGKKKVEIQTMRETEEKGSKGETLQENYLPPEYNSATTLTEEVTVEGPNEFEFNLKSKL